MSTEEKKRRTYIVTFDVSDKARLAKLKGVLKNYKAYCPIHENAWAIMANEGAAEIRDKIMKHTTTSDRLFVIRTGTEAAWKSAYGKDHSEWLKKNL